jgi:L-fuconolactonase
MRVDAQVTFLDPARFSYPALPDALRQRFLPEHLSGPLRRNRFDGCLAVARTADAWETRWLLELARDSEIVLGVAGGAAGSNPEEALDEFMRSDRFKAAFVPAERLSERETIRLLDEAARRNVPVELAVHWRQMGRLAALWDRVPGLRAAVSHLESLPLQPEALDEWAAAIEAAACLPGLYIKLSGLLRPEGLARSVTVLTPCVRLLVQRFGPERLMFGSGWPFCLAGAAKWKESLAAFTQMLGPQPLEVREKILGGTACLFYSLE